MKIPDTGRKKALVVIDLQPAFLKPHNKYILPNIKKLINMVPYDAYVEAVFHAEKGSLWDKQQKWICPADDNTNTVAEVKTILQPYNPLQILKDTRSVFKGDKDLIAYLKQHKIKELHLIGTETNDCVFASALDAFDLGYPVYVIEECCESATEGRHELGTKLLRFQGMTNNHCLAHTYNI